MMNFVIKATKEGTAFIKQDLKGNDVLEMKEFFSKFTIDIIASCAFGFDGVNSFKNPDNDFMQIANKVMNPNGFVIAVKFFFLYFFPSFMKRIDISLLDKHTKSFFRKTVNETMNYREKHGIVRADMIHLLMQTKKGNLKFDDEKFKGNLAATDECDVGGISNKTDWTKDELVAQCVLFFLAGNIQKFSSFLCKFSLMS